MRHFIARYQPGAERAKSVAAFALVPGATALALVLALADVIDGAVASDKVERGFLRHVTGARADHHTEFDFPIGLERTFGQHDRVIGSLDASGGFHEYNRLFRNRQPGLGGMVGVVQADGNELAHTADRTA